MKINVDKDWYNNLSETGKRATKLNIILARGKLSSQLQDKNNNNRDSLMIPAFEYSENRRKIEEDDEKEDFDIFNITKKTKKNDIYKKINNLLKKRMDKKRKKRYQYHFDSHLKNMKKREIHNNPSCTKYNPKYDSILRGVKSLPLWEKITGRIHPKKEVFEHKFYLQHENIEDTMAGKTFIDMSKQILRRCFDIPESQRSNFNKTNYNMNSNLSDSNSNIINKNRPLTNRTGKTNTKRISSAISSYSDIKEEKRKKKPIASRPISAFLFKKKIKKNFFNDKIRRLHNDSTNINTSNNNLIDTSNNIINKNNIISNNNSNKNIKLKNTEVNNDDDSDLSKDSFDLFKHVYIKKKKKNEEDKNEYYKLSKKGHSSKVSKKLRKQKIKAPDFRKCLSRESLSKIEDNKTAVTPYLLPNYESVRPKQAMMVVYNIKKHKINRAKSDSLLNLDNRYYYDENKALDNINNHISIHPPDFNLMMSRPIDNQPLPSYMKKIFDRNSCYGISDNSLKLNNYRNRGFTSFKSSFWPKISFNKVINLNLLKSKKFLDNIIFDENKKEIKNKLYGSALKFYNKNYEEILKEEGLPQFDNITYKSLDKKNKKIKELVKYINIDKIK